MAFGTQGRSFRLDYSNKIMSGNSFSKIDRDRLRVFAMMRADPVEKARLKARQSLAASMKISKFNKSKVSLVTVAFQARND